MGSIAGVGPFSVVIGRMGTDMNKKLIIFLLLLFFPSIVLATTGQIRNVVGMAKSSADTYSDILLFNRMESTALSTGDCYGADSTMSAATSNATFPSDEAEKLGTYGLKNTGTGTTLLDVSTNDIFDPAEGRVGFWLYFSDAIANNQEFFRVYGASILNDAYFVNTWGGALDFNIKNGGTDVAKLASSGVTFSTATWYFIEVAWKSDSGRKIYVNGVERGSNSTSFTAPSIATFQFGAYFSGVGARYTDHYIVSNDWTRNLYDLKDTASCPR